MLLKVIDRSEFIDQGHKVDANSFIVTGGKEWPLICTYEWFNVHT